MYDEFERAVTGKNHEGLSFLGWLSVALGTLFVLGAVGAGLTAYYVHSRVAHVADRISGELSGPLAETLQAGPAEATAAMVRRLESHAQLLDTPPEDGVALLQDLGSGPPSEAFMDRILGGSLELLSDGKAFSLDPREVVDRKIVEMRSQEDNVRVNVVRSGNGGTLSIGSGEGQVRLDLQKTEDGGFLAIDSEDGQVRFDLTRNDKGGSLVIHSDDGQVRFDVARGGDGGSLVIQADGETFRFVAGSEADAMPSWVRRMGSTEGEARPVYSLDSPEGSLGAVAWQGDQSPEEILSFYKEWLEGEGFELRAEHRMRGDGEDRGSLWARDEVSGRMVFLVAEQDGDMTKVLLGYGEGGE